MHQKKITVAVFCMALACIAFWMPDAIAAINAGTAKIAEDRLITTIGTKIKKVGNKVVLKNFGSNISCDGTDKIISAKAVTAAGSSSNTVTLPGTQSNASVTFTDTPLSDAGWMYTNCPKNKVTPNVPYKAPVTVEFTCKKSSGQKYVKHHMVDFTVNMECDQRPEQMAKKKPVGFQYSCPAGYQAKNAKGIWSRIIYSEDPNMGWSNPAICYKRK